MTAPLLELEGIWEQIAALGKSLAGRRVRLTVLPSQMVGEPANVQPIEVVFAEMMADLPEEERAKLPALTYNLNRGKVDQMAFGQFPPRKPPTV